ncbi:MAG TPA: hypothetical protein VFI91_09535 [Longimicrobiaceae bacterium]|nr:hypothetical protein [Longimicrobiaceae bacterium]
MNTIMAFAFVLQAESSAVARAGGGLDTFALFFMLISMASVIALMVWCFWRILSDQEHFDPDGTGPARSPVQHDVE